jgi:predicted nucleotidyltransferase
MQRHSVESMIAALNQYGVQYLVVGGSAVVAHGYVRFTADVDLMLALRSRRYRPTPAIK